jgi:GntR family transcriptional regulator/MocR family aminotransferase
LPLFAKIHSKGPVVGRSRHLFLPPVTLDRSASSPLHRQIRRQIESAIGDGVAAGLRLPSSRTLARLLGVSRNTVLTAYDELAANGLIAGRRGAAMIVTTAARTVGAVDLRRLLRDAQYPSRTLSIGDPDGNVIDLSY